MSDVRTMPSVPATSTKRRRGAGEIQGPVCLRPFAARCEERGFREVGMGLKTQVAGWIKAPEPLPNRLGGRVRSGGSLHLRARERDLRWRLGNSPTS